MSMTVNGSSMSRNVGSISPPDDADTSTDPMYAYARNLCAAFLASHANDNFESGRKILAGLGIGGEEVYLIHDDTMFHSGKNGFAITSEGLRCRDFGDRAAHVVSWDAFSRGERPELDDSYVRQGDTTVCYFTDNEDTREDLYRLYLRLWRHAQNL